MKNILIIGAGKSSSSLITYLLDNSFQEDLYITIGDISIDNSLKIINHHSRGKAIILDILNKKERQKEVEKTDLVISMLPANLHFEVAKDCILFKKHLVTASYISEEMRTLNKAAVKNKLVFMNEIGLDPGIDHMSAMKVIDKIKNKGGKMLLFESFCGGLVAPESDTNLWNYKFTWNPRNVVLAGQGGAAMFIQEGTYKYIPYHKLFRRTEFLNINEYGKFEAYANRDSLKYRSIYGLDNIPTMYRGTIRKIGFSRAWNIFVQLGMTDDSYIIENSENMSYRDFVNLFLAYSPSDSVELKLKSYLKIDQDDLIWEKLVELDIFNPNKKVGLKIATPAKMLQKILEKSWTLEENDKDMIVMQHLFGYELTGKKHQIESSLVVLGENHTYTAMAKTVGLPVAIAAIKILKNEITTPGVQIPISKEVYEPILKELEKCGIKFIEREVPYLGYNPDNVIG
ncbi:MAG: saccharopine dehydrogenase [Flavobacteriia bacterium]|nr:saccharopine dehydrogenase [Flavobacteriia bacterium]OIP45712.1 MAG: saccharopine dehydrogenase [Flavobacteriaceae bacterium CG2_30_31_66]PIV97147.1 MAG: saccharopine dehydrogenase [Flavobacteriaceae bacterium CG17_big_fil_post_rev_8_21_14_2_50_31_13]PIX13630.1 MAG: saccharopine dehydrogenase [Flavobacteriaceae bacterium CG_4_8_14_3_um_filter_31_8]PIY14866.1 MAG: saccharopine dehydrogenase [Flavobacteriaceae bacterium CG_4_10_14_3_um_filter_31_253]PIZ09593.1 MAG: saccharopine dehydrogenase 